MTERPSQSADGSGIAQADNGATAIVNNYTTNNFPLSSPRPARAIHLNPPPALFIGREPELATLHQHLAREGAVVYIPGFPGRGKSTLANFYAHQRKDEYDSVHWLPCHSKSLVEIAAEFAWQLELKLDGDLEANLKQLRAHCARTRCLLILDNVDDEAPAGMLLGGRSSIIVTTWHTILKFLRPVPSIPLPVFTEDQCFELFRAKIGAKEVDRHLAESRLLFDRLEHHPFALDIAGSLIVEDPRYTIAGMARNLPADIPALFAEAIAALSPAARELLAAMAACAPEGFRLSLAAEVAGFDEAAALDALYEIRARSLADELDRDTHRYRLHALVREAAGPTGHYQARHAEAIADEFEGWKAKWRGCEEDMADWRVALQWFLTQPGDNCWNTANRIAQNGYRMTHRLGRLVEAYEISVSMHDRAKVLEDIDWVQAWLANQALILQAWGRLEDAMAMLMQQNALCVEIGYKQGLQASYANQAVILQDWGRLHDAMALYKQDEALCVELNDEAGLQKSYGNQATILQAWGKLDDAMALHKKEEALCVKLGDEAGLQTSYGNQAVIFRNWGEHDTAMVLLKQQETLCVDLGHKAGLMRSYGNQAVILQDLERLDEAMAMHKQQEALCVELGDKISLQGNYGNQGLVLRDWGRLDEALAMHQREEVLCVTLGTKAGLASCVGNQGLLARSKGDTKMEREKLRQALTLFTELEMPREKQLVQSWLDRANSTAEPEPS